MYGPIQTRWEKQDDGLQLEVSLPPGATATVTLPAATLEGVTESGKSLKDAQGVTVVDSGAKVVRLESGRYEFTIPRGNTR